MVQHSDGARLVEFPRNRVWSRLSATTGVVMAVLALVGALVGAATRLTAVEVGQRDTTQRLDRIEVRIDRISDAVGAAR